MHNINRTFSGGHMTYTTKEAIAGAMFQRKCARDEAIEYLNSEPDEESLARSRAIGKRSGIPDSQLESFALNHAAFHRAMHASLSRHVQSALNMQTMTGNDLQTTVF